MRVHWFSAWQKCLYEDLIQMALEAVVMNISKLNFEYKFLVEYTPFYYSSIVRS
jgi:hypothetical protein